MNRLLDRFARDFAIVVSFAASCLSMTTCCESFAAPITFSGHDVGAETNDPRPNAEGARDQFVAAASALGSVQIADFEIFTSGGPVGSTPIVIGPGVTIAKATGPTSNISNAFGGNVLGFNTTPGGQFRYQTDTDREDTHFAFAVPISAFGAYWSGFGTGPGSLVLSFDDGVIQSYSLFPLVGHLNGGVGFFGFIDPGKQISEVVITGGTADDVYAIDDIHFVGVPEPCALTLLGIGALCLFTARRRGQVPS